jgi:hypothetical protein
MYNLSGLLAKASGNFGTSDVHEVKTIYCDGHYIPLTTCYGQRKNALHGEVILINKDGLAACHYTECVDGGGEKTDERLGDVLCVGHVCLVPFVTDIIHEFIISVKLFLHLFLNFMINK